VLGTASAVRQYGNPRLLEKHADALVVVSDMPAQAVELHQAENMDKARREAWCGSSSARGRKAWTSWSW